MIHSSIHVIDASQEVPQEKSHWETQALDALRSRRNFVIVFNPAADGLARLGKILDCSPSVLPEKLSKWAIIGLHDVLAPEDQKWLLSVYSTQDLRLIEQLQLARNRPPQIKQFILYCESRGIISDHDTLEDAREALWLYLEDFRWSRLFPMAGIYQWHGEWMPVRKM